MPAVLLKPPSCRSPTARLAGLVGADFLPSQLPDLAAWFRFGRGITSSGGAVSQWNDDSGNARHLLQATGANQPTLQSDGSILFDGSNDYLKCVAFTLAQPATVYWLGKQVTWTVSAALFGGDTANTLDVTNTGSSPNVLMNAGSSAATNTNLALDVYAALAAVYNGASSLLQVNNTTATTGNAASAAAGGFTLGAKGNLANFSNIQVKEVLIFSAAHDAETRARVMAYLARVGGLSI